MLTIEEVQQFINEDAVSTKKSRAKKGQEYYEGRHDIKDYILYYYDKDGEPVVDKYRSNIKIPHPFFTELVDQAVQYILSGSEGIVQAKDGKLQQYMDEYFNENEDFISELSEVLTGCQAKGFEYMYAYKNAEDRLAFQCADSIGVVEVEGRFASDNRDHTIYWYIDRIDKQGKAIKKIMVWDDTDTFFYKQEGTEAIEEDNCFNGSNQKPHTVFTKEGDKALYYENFGFIPFFRLDNNKKQISGLQVIKDLIDDYDLMASSLSNNLVDFDTPLHVVKGFPGDDMDKLQQNLKTKKMIGVDEEGGVEVHTVDVPYAARKEKLELDEKNIYRFGMGLNTSGLKDTNATTNIAIKASYSLLDLRCSKLIIRLKQFMKKIIKVVLEEINAQNGTDYQMKDIRLVFEPEIMSNAQENAQIALLEAQEQQARVTTLLNVAAHLDNETLMRNLCDALDIEYEEIKSKLPDPEEAQNAVRAAQGALNNVPVVEEGDAVE